jgi:beta-mannosidase
VYLESFIARIEDVRINYDVDSALSSVKGTITAAIDGRSGNHVNFSAALDGATVFQETAEIDATGTASVEFHINDPKLWYPHDYGKQTLYDVTATLVNNDKEIHSVTKRTGFRKATLVQEKDHIGRSFYFNINGIDVFCGGSDWIPADSFTPRISKAKYRRWLEMMVDGYQVMIRVWGGGIWEEDVFYELCDELGVLVWQDFMFGCGNYPAYPEMLKSIEEECICQTKRLRHHPSLVIYAGNNEDYQVQESFGLTYNFEDKDPKSWLKTDFPARYIYEKVRFIKII